MFQIRSSRDEKNFHLTVRMLYVFSFIAIISYQNFQASKYIYIHKVKHTYIIYYFYYNKIYLYIDVPSNTL